MELRKKSTQPFEQHLHLITDFLSPIKITRIGQIMLTTLWLITSNVPNKKATPINASKIPGILWQGQQQFVFVVQALSSSILSLLW